jgi:hypothetical protein
MPTIWPGAPWTRTGVEHQNIKRCPFRMRKTRRLEREHLKVRREANLLGKPAEIALSTVEKVLARFRGALVAGSTDAQRAERGIIAGPEYRARGLEIQNQDIVVRNVVGQSSLRLLGKSTWERETRACSNDI